MGQHEQTQHDDTQKFSGVIRNYRNLDMLLSELKPLPTAVGDVGPDVARPFIALGALMGYVNCNPQDTRATQEFSRIWEEIKDSGVLVPSGNTVGAEAATA